MTSSGIVDRPGDVREGEELDTGRLAAYFKEELGLGGRIEVSQYPSGFSNLTYLLDVGGKELVLRRPPFGRKAKTAHDMDREYRILKALRPVFPYCPEVLAYTDDPSILGGPFYVMERVRGVILRKKLPSGLAFTPDQARQLCTNLVDVHLELHSVDFEKAGLGDFGKPEGYVERQVAGWSERYRAARTDDVPDFETVMTWLKEKQPPDTDRPAVVHNDFKFDNIVLDPGDPMKIVGVLDWEMATIGDPLMDLGNSLSYWVEQADSPSLQMMRLMPTNMDGALTREEIVRRYAGRSGRTVPGFDFYRCFGLFRLAVIAQQIYYRFHHGQTRDERFRMLLFAVAILDQTAREVIERSAL